MAKVTAGAAGSQLKRVGNYVAPQVNAAADRLASQANSNRALNDAKEERTNKRIFDAQAGVKVDVDALVAKATGFKGRDDLARDYANSAVKRSEEYANLAREAASKQDWNTMNMYQGKINRIKGDFKNTVNDEAILADIFKGYQEKYNSGEIDDDEWLDFARSMEEFNYEITLDENDNKVIRAIVLDDEGKPELDDSGKPKVIEKSWSDVVSQKDNPYERVQLEDKEGKKGLIGDMLATMGKRKYDDATGQFITTTQTWDDQAEKQFMAKVKGLQSDNRTMHSILKQASGGEIIKKKNFTGEDKKMVEDYLRFQVKGGYDTEEKASVRGRTVDEMDAEGAKNRAVTMRGQDIGKETSEENNKIALEKIALERWKAENPDKNKATTKDELTKESSKLAFEIATKIANVTGDTEEEKDAKINKIGSEYGLNTSANSDWWGKNEFNLDGEAYLQDDPHEVAKAIAKKMGYEYDATYAQEQLTKKLGDSKKTTTPTANMTPQEKIDYYKNLNKN